MQTSLAHIFEKLEVSKNQFLGKLSSFSKSQVHFKPNGGWCMLEVGEHLWLAEQGTLFMIDGFIPTKINNQEKQKNDAAYLGSIAFLESSGKASAPPVVTPTKIPSLSELQQKWLKLNKKWEKLTHNAPMNSDDLIIINHPVGGKMNLRQCMSFNKAHIFHHAQQIKRIQLQFTNRVQI